MIVVDTNVLSEFMRAVPAPAVISWLGRQNLRALATTAITEAELLLGEALLPLGKRRNELALAIEKVLGMFADRILPFDRDAARQLPAVFVQRRAAGFEFKDADGRIAAIARVHGAAIATRDTIDFMHCGVDVINPWTD